MIVFTDPRGWWLLGLAALIIALLLLRWRRRTVPLSTFFLLRRIAEGLTLLPLRARLLRKISLLLVHAALVILAVAGFRPVLLAEAPALRELVIVDRSPSLGVLEAGRPRAARLRELLGGYLDRLQAEDTLFIVTAGPQAGVSPRLRGPREAREWLGEIGPHDAAADLGAALRQAAAIAAREGPAHVIVFTDLPERWTAEAAWEPLVRHRPTFVAWGSPRENAGIVAFELRPDFRRPGDYDLYLRAARHTPAGGAPRPYTFRVTNNGRAVETVSQELSPGGTREILLRGLTLAPGRVEVALDPPDDWPADDVVQSGVAGRARIRVVLATGANQFLRKALAANPAVELHAALPGEPVPALRDAVYVFDGSVPEGELPERALFIVPNRSLEGLGPGAFLPPPDRVEGDTADAVLRGVDLRQVTVRGYLAFDQPGAFRDAMLGDGRPLVLLSDDPRRRWAVLAFDPAQTSFVYTASYPVLLANLLHWSSLLGGGERGSVAATAGVRLPAAAAGGRVRKPDGSSVPVAAEATRVPFPAADRAGRYRVTDRAGKELGEFFLNVTDPAVTASLSHPGYGRGGASLPEGLARPRLRRELAPWLVVAALGLLALEALVRPRAASGRN